MKASDIREMTNEELNKSLHDSRRELFNLRHQMQTGQLENSDRIRQLKRDIARMLTEDNKRAQKTA